MHIGSVLKKTIFTSIDFVWLNFIWDLKLLEFEVGGYDKMENLFKTILKLTNWNNPQQLLYLYV